MTTRTLAATLTLATAALTLAACGGGSDPLTDKTDATTSAAASTGEGDQKSAGTIIIGTANFPESEIIGHIWADVLTDAGYTVEMKNRIGSREVYLKALQEGAIDIIPEYSGNLAEYFIKATKGTPLPVSATEQQVIAGLKKALPAGLAIGTPAPGESKDSFRVTKQFAEQHKLASIEDLKNLDSFTLAANPEIAQRPFGPAGLESTYGIAQNKIQLKPISDSGGPLTIKALTDGSVDVANVYTTSPTLDAQGNEVELVTLKDPKQLILPQHVLPLMRGKDVPAKARELLNGIDKNLTTEALVAMNTENVGPKKMDAAVVAEKFVKQHSAG